MSQDAQTRLTFAVSTHDWYDTYDYGWWEEEVPLETKRRLFPGDILEVQLWFELGAHQTVRDGRRNFTLVLDPPNSRPNAYHYVGRVRGSHKWMNIDSWRQSLGIEEHTEFLIDCGVPIVADVLRRKGQPEKTLPMDRSIIEGEAELQANLCLWDGYFHSPVKGRLVDVIPAEIRDQQPIGHFMTLDLVAAGNSKHSISWSNPNKRMFDTGEAIKVLCPYCNGSEVTRAWMGESRRKRGSYCHSCLRWSRTNA